MHVRRSVMAAAGEHPRTLVTDAAGEGQPAEK